MVGQKSKDVYDMLYDFLSEKIDKLVDIDIVFDEDAPMELKNHICKYGVVLFQTKPSVFADFKERVMLEYSDFAPIRAMFSNATLSRINP